MSKPPIWAGQKAKPRFIVNSQGFFYPIGYRSSFMLLVGPYKTLDEAWQKARGVLIVEYFR